MASSSHYKYFVAVFRDGKRAGRNRFGKNFGGWRRTQVFRGAFIASIFPLRAQCLVLSVVTIFECLGYVLATCQPAGAACHALTSSRDAGLGRYATCQHVLRIFLAGDVARRGEVLINAATAII
jgi:hypothetical protein